MCRGRHREDRPNGGIHWQRIVQDTDQRPSAFGCACPRYRTDRVFLKLSLMRLVVGCPRTGDVQGGKPNARSPSVRNGLKNARRVPSTEKEQGSGTVCNWENLHARFTKNPQLL